MALCVVLSHVGRVLESLLQRKVHVGIPPGMSGTRGAGVRGVGASGGMPWTFDWATGGEVMVCCWPGSVRQLFCPKERRGDMPRGFEVKM